MSSQNNPETLIDHTCNDNGNNLLNTKEEVDVTPIYSISATNDTSMNDYEIFIQIYYALFFFK